MDREIKKQDKEAEIMVAGSVEYNEKVFLSELENSLKEMREKKNAGNHKSAQSSWHDLFTMDEE